MIPTDEMIVGPKGYSKVIVIDSSKRELFKTKTLFNEILSADFVVTDNNIIIKDRYGETTIDRLERELQLVIKNNEHILADAYRNRISEIKEKIKEIY